MHNQGRKKGKGNEWITTSNVVLKKSINPVSSRCHFKVHFRIFLVISIMIPAGSWECTYMYCASNSGRDMSLSLVRPNARPLNIPEVRVARGTPAGMCPALVKSHLCYTSWTISSLPRGDGQVERSVGQDLASIKTYVLQIRRQYTAEEVPQLGSFEAILF